MLILLYDCLGVTNIIAKTIKAGMLLQRVAHSPALALNFLNKCLIFWAESAGYSRHSAQKDHFYLGYMSFNNKCGLRIQMYSLVLWELLSSQYLWNKPAVSVRHIKWISLGQMKAQAEWMLQTCIQRATTCPEDSSSSNPAPALQVLLTPSLL